MKHFFRGSVLMLCLWALAVPGWAVQTVRLAAAEHRPYLGEGLLEGGYAQAVVAEAFARAGYRLQVDYYPVARARREAVLGRVDGWISFQATGDADDEALTNSSAFPGGQIGLLTRRDFEAEPLGGLDTRTAQVLRRLAAYRFGVVRGARIQRDFDQADFLNKQYAASDLQNVDKLVAGRVDFVVIDKYVAASLMVDKRPYLIGQLEFRTPALIERGFHVAFSRRSARQRELRAAFDRALATMRADGTLQAMLERHGLDRETASPGGSTTLTIGTVNNAEMQVMQTLSREFEQAHPGVRLRWQVLDENTLRRRLLSDLAVNDGVFDVMTIGAYEAPIWARRDWLAPVELTARYDYEDVLAPVRAALSHEGRPYALPFYAESSMLFYRTDLFEAAGLSMPRQPTWMQIERFAQALHAPAREQYGICLRGKPGWGENITIIGTMANTYGGRWFDEHWHPDLLSPAWRAAVDQYQRLLGAYGPPDAVRNSYNENLALFADGHCAMWVDATVAAGTLYDGSVSQVSDRLGFAPAPVARTPKGAHWLWVWALAVPASSSHRAEAMQFIRWATSKGYIRRVAQTNGWVTVPPGTRRSTYESPAYRAAAPFAEFVLEAIESADPIDSTALPKPYVGIQVVGIPEFTAIGRTVGLNVARVLQGELTVDEALQDAQREVDVIMRRAGYY